MGPIQLGDGTDQRSVIDRITLTLDGEVGIDPNAFVLTKRGASGGVVDTSLTTQIDSSGNSLVTIGFHSFVRDNTDALIDVN